MGKLDVLQLTDQEIIVKIKEDSEHLGVVYKKCKSNTIRFLQKITSGSIKDYELDDVFHDGVIILYEKIISGNFVLTSALQTYLNSVCRFQLLNTLGKTKLTTDFDGYTEKSMEYDNTITDSLKVIEDSNERQFKAMEAALEAIKIAGGHCYELLTLFWYHKKSMKDIAEIMNYTNASNAKHKKSRCQKRLKVIAFNKLNN